MISSKKTKDKAKRGKVADPTVQKRRPKKPAKRFEFTAEAVHRLPPKRKQYDCWDTTKNTASGFGVRVAPSGAKSWQIVLRVFNPETKRWIPTRIALGRVGEMSLADARKRASERRQQAGAGADIRKRAQRTAAEAMAIAAHAAQEAAEINSFGAVSDAYLADCEKRTRPATLRNYGQHLARFEALKDKPLSQTAESDFYTVIDRLEAEGKNTAARRVHETLRRLFKWAIDEKRFSGEIPVKRKRPGVKEASRTRFLSDREIGIVWRACGELDPIPQALMRLLILLGQRSAETVGMQWSEVVLDGDASAWTIPPARAKTGNKIPTPHILPLPRAAVDILSGVPRIHKNPYVFWGRTEGKPVHADQGNTVKTLRRHCDSIVKTEGIKGVFAETWSAHDLRRTLATGMARLSIDQHLADLVIHHHVGNLSTVARVYRQYNFEREARAALEKWAKHVIDLGSAT